MEVMETNNVLIAVALIEKVESQLKANKRDQLTRQELSAIRDSLDMTLIKLSEVGVVDVMTLGYFLTVNDVITNLLDDNTFDVTDTETKIMIAGKISNGLDSLYLLAGKYYDTEHSFKYSFKMNALLQRIVNVCVNKGYYFGYEI